MRALRILAAAAASASLMVPSVAFAAAAQAAPSAVPTTSLPPAPLSKRAPLFDVQLWPEPASVAILVNATVPTSTPLPVRMRLPLPDGATIEWIGEILGDVPEQDLPSLFKLTDDGTVVEMVLTTSRMAQYEASYRPAVQEGGMLVSRLEWVQSVPASSVRFAVRASAGIQDVTVTPASDRAPQFNDAGERLYLLDEKKMKVGERATIGATYRAGTGSGSTSGETASSGTSGIVAALLGVLGIVVVTLVVVLRRQARAAGRS